MMEDYDCVCPRDSEPYFCDGDCRSCLEQAEQRDIYDYIGYNAGMDPDHE